MSETKNETATPRTRKVLAELQAEDILDFQRLGDHAMELERELIQAKEELKEWQTLMLWGGTPEKVEQFIKAQQDRIHACQNLETELASAREEVDRLRAGYIALRGLVVSLQHNQRRRY